MKENAKGLWAELTNAFNGYWQDFIEALPRIAFALLILLITWQVAIRVSRIVRGKLSRKAQDPLFSKFVSNLIRYTLLVSCLILFLHVLGLTGIAGGLLAGAGISAFIFGFAFKDIAENFLAGIILAFDRPFSLNDTVRIGEYTGHVTALNFRTTHLKTFDEKDVFIPNAKIIKETLVNLTRDGVIRIDFVIGIAYENEIAGALDLIVKTMAGTEDVLKDRTPFAVVEEMSVNTVNIRAFFWSHTDDYKKGILITKSMVVKKVKEALLDNGYSLPANVQELKMYGERNALSVSLLSSTQNDNGAKTTT